MTHCPTHLTGSLFFFVFSPPFGVLGSGPFQEPGWGGAGVLAAPPGEGSLVYLLGEGILCSGPPAELLMMMMVVMMLL